MEVIALFYFVIIPGCIIGFFVGFFWLFRKINLGGRFFVSIVFGLMFGYFSPCIVSIPAYIRSAYERSKNEHLALEEATYFKDALSGRYSDKDITLHYKRSQLSWLGERKIGQELYYATQSSHIGERPRLQFITKIEPKSLPALIRSFENKPEIVGLLVALPDTPVELKYEIAESKYPAAVKYLASSKSTPSDILLKLATHPSTDIARTVYHNKNAPSVARTIYLIRAPFSEDWRHHDEVRYPRGFDFDEGKKVWTMLCIDRRDYVRTWVARSQGAPPKLLAVLADDPNKDILRWVALNKNSTPSTKNKAAHNLSKRE
jgi:hypothetical protein